MEGGVLVGLQESSAGGLDVIKDVVGGKFGFGASPTTTKMPDEN